MKTIYIKSVSMEEVNEWLVSAIETAEEHDRNVIGTIGIMLEDFSEFVHNNPKRKMEFMEYLQSVQYEAKEEILH